MEYTKGEWKADDYRQVICEEKVICFIGLRGHMEDDEDKPNAQLIASAPDHNVALKDMLVAYESLRKAKPLLFNMLNEEDARLYNLFEKACIKSEQALAKVKGK